MMMQEKDSLQIRLEESKSTHAPFIDLGNCGLTELPPEISAFTWLEDINLGTVYWDESENNFRESRNNGPLNHLQEEDFQVLAGLAALRRISLRSCSVKDLPGLSRLTQLRSLTLGGNDISDITPLENLANLEVLSLFDNPIQNIQPVGKLQKLQVLSLNYNKIDDISALAGLLELRELHLAGNRISDIRPISQLPKLEKLNLTNNRIRKIRSLVELPKLSAFSLDRNPVEDCPPEIAFSGDLERIRSYFSTLSRSAGIEKQASADIDKTGAEPEPAAPPAFEVKLILVGNATSGKTSLSRTLRNESFNQRENTTHGIQINEWLLAPEDIHPALPPGEPLPTQSLRVNIWDFGGQEYYHGTHQIFLDNNAVYLLLWDLRHNTNQTLPTEVYFDDEVVTVQQEHFNFRYWLDNIRFHASGLSTDGKPPIVLLQNKIDLEDGRPALLDLDLVQQYEVRHTAGVSAKLARSRKPIERRFRYGFEIFREDLIRILHEKARENAQLDHLPAMWTLVRGHMRDIRNGIAQANSNPFVAYLKDQSWIAYDDFAAACRALNPDLNDAEVETLAYYLHQIGAVVWLPHIDRKVYTDPAWLTGKIYRVLNERVRRKNGRFTTKDVQNDFKDEQETELLLSLMREWEIIFPSDAAEHTWVAPQYLPEEHPMENLFNIALTGLQETFYMVQAPLFHYRKILRRLIFQYGNDPTVGEKTYWKNGILFVTKTNRLRVFIKGLKTENLTDEGRLMICVERDHPEADAWRQRIFTDLLATLLDKPHPVAYASQDNAPWLNLANYLRDEAEKRKDLLVSVDGKDFVSLAALIHSADAGQSAIMTENGNRYRLQDFNPLLKSLQITPKEPTIFFSYAHDDKSYRDELDKHLAPFKRLGKAKTWFDGEIGAGQNWEETIRKNLRNADVILLLISHNFISSQFIWENELSVALERHKRGECRVIPVLLRPCYWEDLPFAALQMLPQVPESGRLKALTLWENADEGYTAIVRGIQKAIQELGID